MSRITINLLKPFPFFFNSFSNNLKLVISLSLFAILFLWIFQPNNYLENRLVGFQIISFGFITFIALSFNLLYLPRYFPNFIQVENWTLLHHLLMTLWNFFLIAFFIFIYKVYLFEDCEPTISYFLHSQLKVISVGIMPMLIVTYQIQNRQLRSSAVEQPLSSSIAENIEKEIIINTETQETLKIFPKELLFAEAQGHYANLVWQENESIKERLLRITLKDLLTQIGQDFITRCHRSFIININQVEEVRSNSGNLKLIIQLSTGKTKEIPVSRAIKKDILKMVKIG